MKLAKHIESILVKRNAQGEQEVIVTLMAGYSFEADDEVICQSFKTMAEARYATTLKRLHGKAKKASSRQEAVKVAKKFVDHQTEQGQAVPEPLRVNKAHYVYAKDNPDLAELCAAAELTMDDSEAPRGLRTSARAVYKAITTKRPDLHRQLVEAVDDANDDDNDPAQIDLVPVAVAAE